MPESSKSNVSPLSEAVRADLMLDVLRSGEPSENAIRTTAQFLGFEPCSRCDFIVSGCRCHERGGGDE